MSENFLKARNSARSITPVHYRTGNVRSLEHADKIGWIESGRGSRNGGSREGVNATAVRSIGC